jgi:hypothetical protein
MNTKPLSQRRRRRPRSSSGYRPTSPSGCRSTVRSVVASAQTAPEGRATLHAVVTACRSRMERRRESTDTSEQIEPADHPLWGGAHRWSPCCDAGCVIDAQCPQSAAAGTSPVEGDALGALSTDAISRRLDLPRRGSLQPMMTPSRQGSGHDRRHRRRRVGERSPRSCVHLLTRSVHRSRSACRRQRVEHSASSRCENGSREERHGD